MRLSTMADITEQTALVFAKRMEVVKKMFAGEASYDDVLAFHSTDFIWLSPSGPLQGHTAAREYSAQRMAVMPADAFKGMEIIRTHIVGEYAFLIFKTELIPFGTDTFIIRDGKVVFQSNAVYLPRAYREQMKARKTQLP